MPRRQIDPKSWNPCIVDKVLSKFADLSFDMKANKRNSPPNQDHMHEYVKESLTMGLLLLEFKDAIREGDGDRDLGTFFGVGSTSSCTSEQPAILIIV